MAEYEINDEEAEVIDEWLDEHRGQGIVCMTHSVKIYFPVSTPGSDRAFEELLATCNEVFGGSTVYDAEGSWCEKSPCRPENVVTEPVKVIEASHNCTTERDREIFANALKKAAQRTNQTAVGIAGTNKFYIIPTGAL